MIWSLIMLFNLDHISMTTLGSSGLTMQNTLHKEGNSVAFKLFSIIYNAIKYEQQTIHNAMTNT